MAYFMIGDTDYSAMCNKLKVNNSVNYTAQTNAAGNSVVDYINTKRTIEVGIIPLSDADMIGLQIALSKFNVSITIRNPLTNGLETINCIIPQNDIEYYTIQADRVLYKALNLTFTEL